MHDKLQHCEQIQYVSLSSMARQQQCNIDLSSPGVAPCLWNLCKMTKLTFISLGLSQGILIKKKKKSLKPINLIYCLPITMVSAVRHSRYITTKFKCYCFIQERMLLMTTPNSHVAIQCASFVCLFHNQTIARAETYNQWTKYGRSYMVINTKVDQFS